MKTTTEAPVALQAWIGLLSAQSRLVRVVGGELEDACGISLPWYDVLFQLDCVPEGRLRMRELATAVLLSPSGLTRLTDRIEAAGLVTRTAIPGDRRSIHIQLSASGRKLVRVARRTVRRSVVKHLGEPLNEAELVALRDLLGRVMPTKDAPHVERPSLGRPTPVLPKR